MGLWSIVIPETTNVDNLVENPSVELGTAGYSAILGSIARSTTYQRRGEASLSVTPAADLGDGAYYAITLDPATTYTLSYDFLGVLGVPYAISIYDVSNDVTVGGAIGPTGTGVWGRPTLTFTTGAGTSYQIQFIKENSASTGVFYVDGLLCIQRGYDLLYFDGDSDDCIWLGTPHASRSRFSARSRAGGKVVNLDGYQMFIGSRAGAGMPPLKHLVQDQAVLPGALYRGSHVEPRVLTLASTIIGDSLEGLHGWRKDLLDALDEDGIVTNREVVLRYTGSNSTKPIYLKVVYDSGLEISEFDGFSEESPVRFIAYQPFWYEDYDVVAQLDAGDTFTAGRFRYREDGVWGGDDGLLSTIIRSLALGADKQVIVGGDFSTPSGILKIAKWDRVNGTFGGLGNADDGVYAVAVAPNGDILMGGKFGSAGGVTGLNHIARWDGSTWNPLGAGLSGDVYALAFGRDGILYAGGRFGTAGGAPALNIAKWDGSSWSSMGAGYGSTITQVNSIIAGLDGTIYAGGDYTGKVYQWNGTAWTSLGLDTSGSTVYALAVGPDGSLYAGGTFDTAGSVVAYGVAKWNGSQWLALGSGLDSTGTVSDLAIDPSGRLWVVGAFANAGEIDYAKDIALWNGNVWVHSGIYEVSASDIDAVLVDGDSVFLGSTQEPSVQCTHQNAVTNPGTARAHPIFHFKRVGGTTAHLAWIRNDTTGATLYFDYDLLDGEELVVDLRPYRRQVRSSYFGKDWKPLLRGSDVGAFDLRPGVNHISVLVIVDGSPTLTSYVQWQNTHKSIDGVAV